MQHINKMILAIGMIALIGVASALLLSGRTLPITVPSPDGRTVTVLNSALYDATEETLFNITNLSNTISNDSELNTLYYKVFVPDNVGNQWNLSEEFAESKPYFILKPVDSGGTIIVRALTTRGLSYVWACCNISKGDYLFTADATNDSSLRGTLTNMYNTNYKTRLFNYTSMQWENRNIGASTNPAVYNRRAALHQDGRPYAYAMETRNVTNASVPELMKVFLI